MVYCKLVCGIGGREAAVEIISRKDAKAAGLKTYFTGKPCPHGHVDDRRVHDGGCCACHLLAARVRANIYYHRNLALEREKRNQRYHNNPEPGRMRSMARYRANPERAAEQAKTWAINNPARRREAYLRWQRNNPEKLSAQSHRRRARKRGAAGTHTAEEVIALLSKQKAKCAACGKGIRRAYHKDHIAPLARGGSNDIKNIQLLCAICNHKKGAKDPIEFAHKMGRLL